jgi:uncharacterized protein Yka (UPF0111/DUF47 family)
MPGLLTRILPNEKSFFEMFNRQAENVHAGAQALVEMLEHFENPAQGAETLESYEHIGDTLTHAIVMRLNQTFITPLIAKTSTSWPAPLTTCWILWRLWRRAW